MMAGSKTYTPEEVEQVWKEYLVHGEHAAFESSPWYMSKRIRMYYRHLPANPRCRLCHAPFKGFGGSIMRHFFGFMPSRMNPQVCNLCEQFVQKFNGGAEVDLTVLFADVRGSTTMAEGMNPKDYSRLINRFYQTASKAIYSSGGMVEKLIGDAVTGFFVPGISGASHAQVAVNVAMKIIQGTGHHDPGGPWIPVGIGVHTGQAYVGAVISDQGATDVAVLGDTPNIGARLAAQAAPGEIHISQAAAIAANLDSSGVEIRRQSLKGRVEPIDVWVLA